MPSLFPVDDMIGAAQIGVLVSTLIFGITCLQVYRYYTEHCERDRTLLKAWVAVVMVLDTVHMAMLAIFMYHYTVTNFGDYAVLLRPTWSLLAEVPIANFLSVMVQLFYVYRIYRLNHNSLTVPLVIAVLCFAHFAVSIVYTVKAFEKSSFAAQVSIESYNTAGLALDIACDSCIAVCTTYYLRRGFTGVRSTTRAINKLIAYTLNTCLLTTYRFHKTRVNLYLTVSQAGHPCESDRVASSGKNSDRLSILFRGHALIFMFPHVHSQFA